MRSVFRRAPGAKALALLGATLLASACGSLHTTERVFNGQTVKGRYIEPDAYSAYMEGAYREARGEWSQAERAYRHALRSDSQSPQIWTRLGVLACRDSLPRAMEHFERAQALERFGPAWTEQARCLAARQHPTDALRAALEGIRLDPDGAHANLLVVRLYREASQLERARGWLFAWLLLEPALDTAADELGKESRLLADPRLMALTTTTLERHAMRGDVPLQGQPLAANTAPAELQAALRAGELEQARSLASETRQSPLKVGTLALELGRADLALEQSQLLLQANPRNSAALITALLAAAQQGNERLFQQLLRQTKTDELPPRDLEPLLTELLRRRVGDEAADSWRSAYLRALAERTTAP